MTEIHIKANLIFYINVALFQEVNMFITDLI